MKYSYPYYPQPELVSFRQLVDHNAREWPNQIAFQFQKSGKMVNVTYTQFKQDIEALAAYFARQGFRRAKIAVLGENSYEWLLTYFAAVLSDNIIVPIDKELPDDGIARLLALAGADFLAFAASYADTAQKMVQNGIVKAVLPMDTMSAILENRESTDIQTDETALCAIIFTSGTTGTPKGVMLTQKALVVDAVASCRNVDIIGVSLLTLPLHHTFAFTAGVLAMLVYHVPIFINRSLRTFQSDMKLAKPQNIFLVPLYVETMYKNIWKIAKEQGKDKLLRRMIKLSNFLRKFGLDLRRILFKSVLENFGGELSLLVSGGAAIRQEYIDGMDDIGILTLNGYGITECAPVVAVNRNKAYKPNSIGLPLVCNEVKIEDGELCVRGDNVMLGYYQDETATQEAIIDGWFHTGDLGHIDDDGFIFITGRKKNLIILSNGKNVSPEELEDKLLALPNILEVVVSAKDGVLVAEIYAEQRDGIQESVMALNKSLPPYQHIQRVSFRDTPFEKTTTKKIERKQ